MATLLYIESSPRAAHSHSSAIAEIFLNAYQATHPGDQVERLNLWAQTLPRFDGEMLNAKYSIMHGEQPSVSERAAWADVESRSALHTETLHRHHHATGSGLELRPRQQIAATY